MTEEEWSSCQDLPAMLEAASACVPEDALERKWRLLSCAACRRLWPLLPDERSRNAVEGSERFADRLLSEQELDWLMAAAEEAQPGDSSPREWAAAAARWVAKSYSLSRYTQVPFLAACAAGGVTGGMDHEERSRAMAPELDVHCALFRCILGNPFRPVVVDPSWRTSTVVALAVGIHDERAFDRLPILADALQDAGCEDAELLGHCRNPGPHARGCWVLDLVLGLG
jgi:hypothetical protein